MSKKLTDEQKQEYVERALRYRHAAFKQLEESEKYWKKAGIRTCTLSMSDESEVHVFSGIKKLAKLFNAKITPQEDYFGNIDYSRGVITLPSGETCFSIGEPKKSRFVFR